MKYLRGVRHFLEVLPVGLGLILLPPLPRRAIIALSRGLGALAFRWAARLRRIALVNLDTAFGGALDAGQKERIARQSFQTFALLFLDLFWFTCLNRRRVARWVRFDPSFDHYLNHSPVIAVTGHIGNWEVMGQAAAAHGAASLNVAADFENPMLTAMLNFARRRGGLNVIKRQGAVRVLIKTLKDGGRVALLMDQNTVPREGGIFVEFFGLPVPISKAVYHLASRTNAPVTFAYCVPDARGLYTASATPPFIVDEDGVTEGSVAQKVASMSEAVIREHPGRWLWMYRRWKYIPAGRGREGYPAYAKPVPE